MNRLHLLIKLCLLAALALFASGCQKDNIVSVDMIATTDDVSDDIAGTTFAQTVYVAFSDHDNAVVTGATDDFTVTINGNDVTIFYAGEEHIMYELSGTTSDGFFILLDIDLLLMKKTLKEVCDFVEASVSNHDQFSTFCPASVAASMDGYESLSKGRGAAQHGNRRL